MQPIDWIIVFLYASSTIFLGWHFGRKQKNTTEYFVGSGRMNPWLIGVSLFATLLSSISYLAIPGEVLGKGRCISPITSLIRLYSWCSDS